MNPSDFSKEHLEKLSQKQLINLILLLTQEISERKNSEKQLRTTIESLESTLKDKDELISVVSHEIRTPLNAIVGIANLLSKDFSAAEKHENISTLKESSHALLTLINDILDFSKIRSGKLKLERVDFNLRSILLQTQRLFQNQAQEKKLGIEIFIGEDVPEFLNGDPTRLLQILNNLVSNAIKFTKQGLVTISVKASTAILNQPVELLFEISDTGIGIQADKLDEIFEPFSQAHVAINRQYGGTGLGLSIVKNLVEIQGGRLKVKSKENEGTIFSIFLTYERGKVNNNILTEMQDSLPPLKILYVEDVVPNQLLMQKICAQWGMEVILASDGYEGLEKVKTCDYDIILMDLRLPDMSGYVTSEKIRALEGDYFKQLPIVAVTASDLDENMDLLRKSGIDDIIGKPIDQDKLYKIFKKFSKKILTPTAKAVNPANEPGKKIFEQLDKIFQKDHLGYKKTLMSISKEFINYKEIMKAALLERNDKKVADVRHKIAGTSFMLEHKSFYTLLKSVDDLQKLSDQNLNRLIDQVDEGFNELIEEFGKKIRHLEV